MPCDHHSLMMMMVVTMMAMVMTMVVMMLVMVTMVTGMVVTMMLVMMVLVTMMVVMMMLVVMKEMMMVMTAGDEEVGDNHGGDEADGHCCQLLNVPNCRLRSQGILTAVLWGRCHQLAGKETEAQQGLGTHTASRWQSWGSLLSGQLPETSGGDLVPAKTLARGYTASPALARGCPVSDGGAQR